MGCSVTFCMTFQINVWSKHFGSKGTLIFRCNCKKYEPKVTVSELFQGREYMLYTTQMTRDKVDSAIDFFLDTIAQPAFKPWELSDNKVRKF